MAYENGISTFTYCVKLNKLYFLCFNYLACECGIGETEIVIENPLVEKACGLVMTRLR